MLAVDLDRLAASLANRFRRPPTVLLNLVHDQEHVVTHDEVLLKQPFWVALDVPLQQREVPLEPLSPHRLDQVPDMGDMHIREDDRLPRPLVDP